MATNVLTRGLINAHKYYIKGKIALRSKKIGDGLEHFVRAQNAFQSELNKLGDISTREIWEQELLLVDQEIRDLEKRGMKSGDKIAIETNEKIAFDMWIESIREVYTRTDDWGADVIGLDLVKETLDKVISLPLERPDIWMVSPSPPRSILLYGAPAILV